MMIIAKILQFLGIILMAYPLFSASIYDNEGTFDEFAKREKMNKFRLAIYKATHDTPIETLGLFLSLIGFILELFYV